MARKRIAITFLHHDPAGRHESHPCYRRSCLLGTTELPLRHSSDGEVDAKEVEYIAAYRSNDLVPLSAVFSLAVRREWTQTNPVRAPTKSKRPKPARRPKRSLSADEIKRVLAVASEPGRTLVLAAIFCALRQSELLGLTWADIDLDARVLRVRAQLARGSDKRVESKTDGSMRDVPLSPTLVAALRRHRRASAWSLPEHPVFVVGSGRPVSQSRSGTEWDRIRRAAKVSAPLPRFHDLRVTCVSILVAESDGDVAYVSRVLGASPTVLLATYADDFDSVSKSARVTARVDAVATSAVAGLA